MYGKILKILVLFLLFGLLASVSEANSQDLEAEAQKLAQDFQSGKIDMQTFQNRLMDLQKRVIDQHVTPAQMQQIEQLQGQNNPSANPEELMQHLGATAGAREDLLRWQQAHGVHSYDIPFPSSLLAVIPTYQNNAGDPPTTKAEIDPVLPEAKVILNVRLIRPIPEDDRADMTDIKISIRSVNPKWSNAAIGLPSAAEGVRSAGGSAGGRGVQSFTWGAGQRETNEYGVSSGSYRGGAAGGSVRFLLEISGQISIAAMDDIAEKLAAVAGRDCTWAVLANDGK